MLKDRMNIRKYGEDDAFQTHEVFDREELKMTKEQEIHLANIKILFSMLVDTKYRRGQKEHGGNLIDVPLLNLINNAIDECIDQFTYLVTLREKLRSFGQDQEDVK